jgi:hypothetical protein
MMGRRSDPVPYFDEARDGPFDQLPPGWISRAVSAAIHGELSPWDSRPQGLSEPEPDEARQYPEGWWRFSSAGSGRT